MLRDSPRPLGYFLYNPPRQICIVCHSLHKSNKFWAILPNLSVICCNKKTNLQCLCSVNTTLTNPKIITKSPPVAM
jgi:hypothetical protein